MKKFFSYLIFFILIFSSASLACSIEKLNLNNNFNDLKINDVFKTLFKKETKDNNDIFNKYTIPIEAICENNYGGFLSEIYTKNDKIFKVLFINSTVDKKILLELSKKKYFLNFEFENKISNKNNLNSQIKKTNAYYYYTYFPQDPLNNRGFLEIFEIVNPSYSEKIRTTDEMKEEVK